MCNEDNPVKVFVFVARDQKEYEKYFIEKASVEQYDWNRAGTSSNNNRYQWRFSPKMRIMRLVIEKGVLGWDYLRPPKADDDRQSGDKARLADNLDKLRLGFQSNVEYIEKKCALLFCNHNKTRGELRNFLNGLKDESGQSLLKISDVECRIFIHWGGGEREPVLYYERKVSDLLPDNWRLYSLGTNRNELFSVDRPKIIIPSKAEILEELDKKFFDEQRFAGVISDVPLSIVASLGGEINDKTQINAVVLRLTELRNRILLSNIDKKRKDELLDEVAAALNDFENKSCIVVKVGDNIVINEKTIKLARRILNKEVFND